MSVQLKLGDFIQIEAKNNEISGRIFLIDYLDELKICLIDAETMIPHVLKIENGTFTDESITEINILSRANEEGYARQNGLIVNTWVDIYFGGEQPTVITGRISNLEKDEDMIEITLFPDNEVIYINFEFKGLPEHLPIKQINIRPPPSNYSDSFIENEGISEENDENSKTVNIAIPEVRDAFIEILNDADQIMASQSVEEFFFLVDVPEERKRYSIEAQTNDLLEALVSDVPENHRTSIVLNNIHTMISRFKQLRDMFSKFDHSGNAHVPSRNGEDHRPLIDVMSKMKHRLNWIIPVAACCKKMYVNKEASSAEGSNEASVLLSNANEDVVQIRMADTIGEYSGFMDVYKNGGESYQGHMKKIATQLTPFTSPNYEEEYMITKMVQDNITAIIDNLGELQSSVIANNNLKTRRFVIQKYNLGLSKLNVVSMTGSRMIATVNSLTPDDNITIKSMIMLPEPAISYSRVHLKTMNILDKSTLSQTNLNYWQALRKTTKIDKHTIDDLNERIAFNSRDFLNDIKEYVLNPEIQDSNRYEEYLKIIVPRTRLLFELVKKHLVGTLTFSEIVNHLEPFMVYHNDLTNSQYTHMLEFLKERINEHKRMYAMFKSQVNKLRTHNYGVTYAGISLMYNLLVSGKTHSEGELNGETIFESYGFAQELYKYTKLEDSEEFKVPLTTSELMHRMLVTDNARLYMCALAKMNTDLLTPFDFGLLLNQQIHKFKERKSDEESKNKCGNLVIAKQYLSDSDDLENDNGVEIYFDKKFDKTNYDFLKTYETQRETMEEENFILFLKDEIKNKLKITNDEKVELEATAMLLGKRVVKNGDYAVIQLTDENKYLYYIRKNNNWIRDVSIPVGISMYDTQFFCNVQESCFGFKDSCMNQDLASDVLKEGLFKEMNDEFNTRMNENREKTINHINEKLKYYQTILPNIRMMKYNRMIKYNDAQLKHQIDTDDFQDIIQSPYEQLKNAILGQTDLVKRNVDLLNFVEQYTRCANERFGENPYWLYCVKTDVKLLPIFLKRLAVAFKCSSTNGPSYYSVLRTICKEQGELSDEKNMVVDKHSGYIIMQIESNSEEGDDAREMLFEEEIDIGVATSTKTTMISKKYDNPRALMISKIITTMSNYLNVELNPMREFIIDKTIATLNGTMKSEEEYNQLAKRLFEKEKKKVPPYKESLNQSLLLYTLTYLTVAIQVAIPSLKTNKTQPGCIRSFTGYPLLGEENVSGIKYIACIVHQLKNKSVEPWNALKDMKELAIAENIKKMINRYVVTNGEINHLLELKREYMKEHVEDVPEELNIRRLETFLPPLSGVVNPTTNDVSPTFLKELNDNLIKGKKEQHDQLNVLKTKSMYFSLGIQQAIQEVVNKNQTQLLLKPKGEGGVPFLQNACCLEEKNSNTIDFFMSHRAEIKECNEMSERICERINKIKSLNMASTYHFVFTNEIPKKTIVSPAFDESTIYRAVIAYCNYENLEPTPIELQMFVMNKPDPNEFKKLETLSQKVAFLKKTGTNLTKETFSQIIQVVNKTNVIPLEMSVAEWSNEQHIRDIIENLKNKSDCIIPVQLQNHISALMDTYNLTLSSETSEMRSFKSYLSNTCDELFSFIMSFINSNRASISNFSKRRTKFEAIFSTIMDFSKQKVGVVVESDDATLIRAINFTKNCMHLIRDVFPGMINHNVQRDQNSISIPMHWGLTDDHRKDIRKIISKKYEAINKFIGTQPLGHLLFEMKRNSQVLIHFIHVFPLFVEKINNNEKTFSVFDNRTVYLIHKYCFFELLAEHVRMVNYEKIDLQAMQVSNDFDDVFESSEKFAVEEVEITSFDKTAVSRIVVDLLLTYAEVIEDDKLVIDMNVDMIKERVRRTKDKEKESIVDKFDNMTKDQRNIEKFLKDHRMGEWNIGMQKGLREYVGDNYDRERDEINKRLRKERQAGKKDFVSDLQLQIYMDESDSGGDDENEFLLRNLAEDDDNMSDDENITLNHDD